MSVGALATGEDGRVLQEQHGVGGIPSNDAGVHLALDLPGGLVVDQAEVAYVHPFTLARPHVYPGALTRCTTHPESSGRNSTSCS